MAVQLTPQRRVLAMAASQIGYSRWSDSQRGTKYARETQPVFWPRDKWLLANGIAYCDIFVTWVFWKALGEDFVKKGHLPAGASYNTGYRASHGGRVSKSEAAPGDVLVFDWNWNTAATNHVGILEKRLSGDRFQTIEGNTSVGSSGSQSNGGRVARRVRKHSQVRYVIRPNWSKAGGSSESVAATKNPWNSSNTIASLSKAEVKEIQTALKAKGYDLGSYGVDGSYGEATYNAVRAFQKAQGLAVDGVAGPDTRKALTGASKPSAPSKPSSNVWDTSPRIKGMSKAEVISIQKLLIGAGYSVGSYGADGSYKGDTVEAVKKAQKALKLTVDGVAGPDTVAALKKAQKSTSKPSASKAPAFPLPRKPGALYFYGIGKEKTAVTGKMRNSGVPGDVVQGGPLGWYSKGLKLWQSAAGITADGRFGSGTEAKVKALQKKHGKKVDGKIGPETWKLAWA